MNAEENKGRVMHARFIGEDGSMGLRSNLIYEINMWLIVGLLIVKTTKGHFVCPYESLETFFQNWEVF